jgi:hypothetical protein
MQTALTVLFTRRADVQNSLQHYVKAQDTTEAKRVSAEEELTGLTEVLEVSSGVIDDHVSSQVG